MLSFEGIVEYQSEDGGKALIATIYKDEMFVRIQSWDETEKHIQAEKLRGKKVRVTVEVLDD